MLKIARYDHNAHETIVAVGIEEEKRKQEISISHAFQFHGAEKKSAIASSSTNSRMIIPRCARISRELTSRRSCCSRGLPDIDGEQFRDKLGAISAVHADTSSGDYRDDKNSG